MRWHAMITSKEAIHRRIWKCWGKVVGRSSQTTLLTQPKMQKAHLSLSPCSRSLASPGAEV